MRKMAVALRSAARCRRVRRMEAFSAMMIACYAITVGRFR